MNWIFFAVIASMLWALDNVLDRYLLTKKLKEPYTYNILTNFNDVIPALLVLILLPITFDKIFSPIAFFTGVLVVISLFYYNKAMMKDEASRVASLEWTSPILVAILALVFLGQKLLVTNYVGIGLVVLGAILVSREKISNGKIIVSPALGAILIFAVLCAIGEVVSDFSLDHIDYWSFFFWACIGSVSCAVFLLGFRNIRKKFKAETKKLALRTFLIILAVSFFYYIAEVSFYVALTGGLVPLVAAIVATQPLFTLLYVGILRVYNPKILKEHFDGFNVITKIIGAVIIIVGVWFVIA